MSPLVIKVAPLTRAAFKPFGEVVGIDEATPIPINQGFAQRVNALATIDVATEGGIVNVSLFEAKARPRPITVAMMERHPIGSQLFYPLQDRHWLVVVCADPQDAGSYRAFRATGRQGVNYRRNTWHFPLLVTSDGDKFLVVDRGDGSATPRPNLQEIMLETALHLPRDVFD